MGKSCKWCGDDEVPIISDYCADCYENSEAPS